jgi:hypothetical protein
MMTGWKKRYAVEALDGSQNDRTQSRHSPGQYRRWTQHSHSSSQQHGGGHAYSVGVGLSTPRDGGMDERRMNGRGFGRGVRIVE